MNATRRELERRFDRFEMPEPAFERLVRRRERRRRRERIQAAVAAIVVIAIATALLIRVVVREPAIPADHDATAAPDWTKADVNGVVFSNPGGWHLTAYLDGNERQVTLANYAPDPTSSDPCASMPATGAVLRIRSVADTTSAAWPVELQRGDGTADLGCRGDRSHASWTVDGGSFEAEATLGPGATDATRSELLRAFSAIGFASRADAVSFPNSYCFARTPTTAEVLAAETGAIAWTAFATEYSGCLDRGIIVAASGPQVVMLPDVSTVGDAAIQDVKSGERSLVVGVALDGVSRVELTTETGATVVARLVEATGGNGDLRFFVAPLHDLSSGTITMSDATGTSMTVRRFTPFVDCESAPTSCAPAVPPGRTIASSFPGRATWQLVEAEGALELLDGDRAVIASVPTGDRLAATTHTLAGHAGEVTFGVTPSALVMRDIRDVGWGPMPTARLADGATVFWIASTLGETRTIAAFDPSCRPLAAVDATGAPSALPQRAACLGSNGG
jgi:hypothetical protein